jgi:hypothetical protein
MQTISFVVFALPLKLNMGVQIETQTSIHVVV